MQLRELSKPITAKRLNESLAQKFGYKLNLEQFSDVQLEDARNKPVSYTHLTLPTIYSV